MHAPGKEHFPLFHEMQILRLDWEPASLGEACRGRFPKGRSPGGAVGWLGVDGLVDST